LASPDQLYWRAVLESLKRQSRPEAWRQAEAALRLAAPATLATPSPAVPLAPRALAWDEATRRLVARLNRRVNLAILPRPETAPSAWSVPSLAGDDRYGDCRDYALTKRAMLIAAGVPAQALSLAIVRTPQNELHMVLLMQTDRGEFVLDNRSAWITPWAQTGYRWLMRQAPGRAPLDWFTVASNDARAPAGPVQTSPQSEPLSLALN
jgi:predicted transglutaminase-like cysteine proteinase